MSPLRRFTTLLALAAAASSIARAEVPLVSPDKAAARVETGKAVLVDVREPAEWKDTGVVTTAHTLSLSDLRGPREHWKPFLEANKDVELILYCRTGNRSAQAAELLEADGYRVANAGGLSDWVDAGYRTRPHDQPVQPSPSAPQKSHPEPHP